MRRSHLGGSPFIECLAYGRWYAQAASPHSALDCGSGGSQHACNAVLRGTWPRKQAAQLPAYLSRQLPPVTCVAAGSAISSIDPVATLAVLADMDVPPLLYNLVFGESVLNE